MTIFLHPRSRQIGWLPARRLVHIRNFFLVTVQVLAFSVATANSVFGWTLEPPTGSDATFKIDGYPPITSEDVVGGPYGIPNANFVSARVTWQANAAAWSAIDVYDETGILRERIPRDQIPANSTSLWTARLAGENLSIRIESSAGKSAIRVTDIAIFGAAGHLNAVFGSPEFDVPGDGKASPSAWVAPLVADLLIERNPINLGGRVPLSVQSCTGVLLSSSLLLTAAHCVASYPAACQGIVAIFGLRLDQGDAPTVRRCANIEYLGETIDVAVLRLSGSGPSGPFPQLAPLGPSIGDPVVVIGYPGGGFERVAKDAQCKVVIEFSKLFPESIKAHPSLVKKAAFLHRCDTVPGFSGAPILSRDGASILGMQDAGYETKGLNVAVRSDVIAHCIGFDGGATISPSSGDAMCQ